MELEKLARYASLAAVEIDNYISGKIKTQQYVQKISEFLSDEKEMDHPTNQSVVWRAMNSNYSSINLNRLHKQANISSRELRDISPLPINRLKELKQLCIDLSNIANHTRSNLRKYFGGTTQ
jgi:hypothetical protein